MSFLRHSLSKASSSAYLLRNFNSIDSVWLIVICIAVATSMIGCQKEDRWEHYDAGGHYWSGGASVSDVENTVVFSSPRSSHGDIYKVNLENKKLTRLTNSPYFENQPVYSPSGKQIAYVIEPIPGKAHIWIMNSDGKAKRKLSNPGLLSSTRPTFSDDGSKLFFVGVTSVGNERKADFFQINIDGTDLRPVNSNRYGAVASDEKSVIVSRPAPNSDRREIWRIATDGSGETKLGYGDSPAVSRDGSKVICLSDDDLDALWLIDCERKQQVTIAAPTGHKSRPRFCFGDSSVVVRIDTKDENRGDGQFFIIDLATQTAQPIKGAW